MSLPDPSPSPWSRRDCLRGVAGLAAVAGGALAATQSARSVTVLTFNILAGGTRRGPLEQVANLIRRSKADIVGLQEAGRSGEKLAGMLGLNRFARGGKEVLSRFPLGDETPGRRGVKVGVPETAGVWFFNDHFRPMPYQPYQLAEIEYGKGNPFITTEKEAISEANRARGHEAEALLNDMKPALESGLPVVLTGDFNEPSHHDWTRDAAAAGACKLAVKWPASERIVGAGLTDVYREKFPDPVANPGHTWTPVPAKRDVHDRIDMIYAKGLEAEAAGVIGESEKMADVVVDPFPSDHRAVFAKLNFERGEP